MKVTRIALNGYVFLFCFFSKKEDTGLKPVSHVGKQRMVAMLTGCQCINSKGVVLKRRREPDRERKQEG